MPTTVPPARNHADRSVHPPFAVVRVEPSSGSGRHACVDSRDYTTRVLDCTRVPDYTHVCTRLQACVDEQPGIVQVGWRPGRPAGSMAGRAVRGNVQTGFRQRIPNPPTVRSAEPRPRKIHGVPLCTELATYSAHPSRRPRRPAAVRDPPNTPRGAVPSRPLAGGRSEISGGPRYRMSHLATFV